LQCTTDPSLDSFGEALCCHLQVWEAPARPLSAQALIKEEAEIWEAKFERARAEDRGEDDGKFALAQRLRSLLHIIPACIMHARESCVLLAPACSEGLPV
jgi:hypothetical protein